METNLKFNSAICTSREQSKRLLALGLKKETADMFYSHDKGEDIYAIRACWEDFWDSNKLIDGHIRRHCIPAWSLHRLIEIANLPQYWECISGSWYEEVIATIKSKIHIGELNKEYLEERV